MKNAVIIREIEALATDFSWGRLNKIMDIAGSIGIAMSWDMDNDTLIISVEDDIIKIEL